MKANFEKKTYHFLVIAIILLSVSSVLCCQPSPTTVQDFLARGKAYSDKGDYNSAIADYTQAIRLEPNYWYAYSMLGDAYIDENRKKMARALLTK
jgi:tetratricopeptide (TPR) repeat protein